MKTTLKVHSVETFGTHEGPGIRLVIFLQGCHLRCLYCHNPDTWQLEGGTEYTPEQIMELVEKEKAYIEKKGGLTVSGGEPLIQRKALIELFKLAKKRGIHTGLDTNGTILDDDTKDLLRYTDLVLLDIKHIDDDKHKHLTGVSNYMPLKFAEYLEEQKKPFWIRHVLVPGHTYDTDALEKLGNHFKNYKSLERFEILPYHTYGVYKYKELGIPYKLNGVKPPDQKQVENAVTILSKYIDEVNVR